MTERPSIQFNPPVPRPTVTLRDLIDVLVSSPDRRTNPRFMKLPVYLDTKTGVVPNLTEVRIDDKAIYLIADPERQPDE